MTKNTLKAILIGLLSTFAIACGSPGFDPADHGFGEDVGAEEGGVDGEVEEREGDELADDENDGVVDEDEPDAFGDPVCGDGVLHASERCDDGNEESGDGCTSACLLETEGQISIDIVIDSLISNEAPTEDTCSDVIALVVDHSAIAGDGRCFLDNNANFLDYVLDADVDASGAVTGEIEVILNGGSHFLDVGGLLDDGALSLQFDGVTLVTQNIRAIWNGDIVGIVD